MKENNRWTNISDTFKGKDTHGDKDIIRGRDWSRPSMSAEYSTTVPGNRGSISGVLDDDHSWFGNWWRSGFKRNRANQSRDDKPHEKDIHNGTFIKREDHIRPKEEKDELMHLPGAYDSKQQERIRELELLCNKYEREQALHKTRELALHRTNEDIEKLAQKLKDTLYEQDKVIQDLRNQVDFGKDPNFLWRLPFVKQYLRFQASEKRTTGVLIVECLSLMLTFILLVNFLKLIYYTLLTQRTKQNSFYSDDETMSFSWIQQIPWIEYKVYQIQDWIDGG